MATPSERAQRKHAHRHGRRHHTDPKHIARERVRRGISAYGNIASSNVVVAPQTGHLSPEQFVGYPGGFSTDAGNYTGVEAIEGAAGNGGAGGDGDSGGGDGGST